MPLEREYVIYILPDITYIDLFYMSSHCIFMHESSREVVVYLLDYSTSIILLISCNFCLNTKDQTGIKVSKAHNNRQLPGIAYIFLFYTNSQRIFMHEIL